MSLFENPTQAVGLLAFLSAVLSCMLAGHFATWTKWRLLAVMYFLFLLEISRGWRHQLRTIVNDVMQSAGIYGDRAMIQWALVVTSLAFGLLLLVIYRALANEARLQAKNHVAATVATVVLISLFILEIISFHHVDALLYQIFGGVMLIGWMWASLAFVVLISAMLDMWDIFRPANAALKDN